MRYKSLCAVLVLAVCASATASFAGTLVPFPDWWNWPPGPPDENTRLQYHSFMTDPNLNLPPDWTMDGYPPSHQDVWTLPQTVTYNIQTGYPPGLFYAVGPNVPALADGFGMSLSSPATISKDMGNMRIDENWKELFACVIWNGPAGATLNIGVTSEDDTEITTSQVDYVEPTMPGWRATVVTGFIKPQPDFEVFDFAFTGFTAFSEAVVIDSIYVGTYCAPEPGAIVLLLGFLGAVLLRRRR